jgi:CDP-diacylglycerol--glycerol-3-phosphate 3-phosphatidyltransferase
VSVYALKPAFQQVLRPLVTRLAGAGVTANQVTVAAALGSLAVAGGVALAAPARWPFLLLPVWLFLRMSLNAIDGMLAREHGQKSRLGAYLNELCDVVSDAALYAPFALLPAFHGFTVGLVVVLAALTELAGVLGPTAGASRRYDGPMGKSDRAVVFGALGAWVGLGLPLPLWTEWLLVAVAAALLWTVVNRVEKGLAEAGGAA